MEISKTFATFKLLVAPSGSNTVNMLYMNRNFTTGLCLIYSYAADFAILANALLAEIWTNGFCNYWDQFDADSIHNCDVYYGITCIRRLLYALSFHKWPDSTYDDMKEAFDFPTIYNMTRENYSISRNIEIDEDGNYIYPISKDAGYDFH